MEEQTVRRRTNVGTTAGGLHTWDATVEVTNGTLEQQLKFLDELVLEMDRRWPVVPKEAKK